MSRRASSSLAPLTTVGVQPGIFYLQFVDDDLLVQQRQQLHVDDEVSDVGNGVAVVDHPEVVDTEVQREGQPDVADGNPHVQILRGVAGHHVNGHVLDGRQVEQPHEQQEQQHGSHQNT